MARKISNRKAAMDADDAVIDELCRFASSHGLVRHCLLMIGGGCSVAQIKAALDRNILAGAQIERGQRFH